MMILILTCQVASHGKFLDKLADWPDDDDRHSNNAAAGNLKETGKCQVSHSRCRKLRHAATAASFP